jgi:hypothetical protein
MKKLSKKQKWIAIIVLVLMVIAGLVIASAIRKISTTVGPADLGAKLEYVGKQDLGGCVLWWCENQPYSEYYFATDMSEDELGSYFEKASLNHREKEVYPLVPDGESRTVFGYRILGQEDGFSIDYFDNTEYITKLHHLKRTSRAHVVQILDSSYPIAKSAL